MPSPSAELQAMIYARLLADADVDGWVDDRIYDGVPEDADFPYISFGPTDWQIEDDEGCITSLRETIQIDVWSRSNRRGVEAKNIGWAVAMSLNNYRGELETHVLKSLLVEPSHFEPDPDGETAHFVVVVTALIDVDV